MKKVTLAAALAIVATIVACNKNEQAKTNGPVKEVYLDLSDTAGVYYNNSFRTSADAKVAVGRVLFYDAHLSVNNTISCASCHKQQFAFSDNTAFSRGFEGRMTGRNSPPIQNLTLANKSFQPIKETFSFSSVPLFWDSREVSLKDMVLRPINNHVEMGIADMSTLPAKLQELPYYKELVKDAYGTETITLDIIAESFAWFLSSIEATESRFDKFNRQEGGFTAQELYGRSLFVTKYDCASCHTPTGSYTGNEGGSNIGLDAQPRDRGMAAVNTGEEGAFKIPNLHNVAVTGPYMHDGRFKTLDEVIEHYSTNIQAHPQLDERLRNLNGAPRRMNITQTEKEALIAFLNTMTDYRMLTKKVYSNPFKTR